MTRTVAVVALTVALPVLGAAQSAQPSSTPSVTPRELVGHWAGRPDRVPQSDESGWGRGTTSVRRTDLRIGPSGTGTLTVTTSVVNAAGQVVPGSRVVEVVSFSIGPASEPAGLRRRYTTTITAAERRYLDPPAFTSKVEGLRVSLIPPIDGAVSVLDVDVEAFDGSESFTDTLRRVTSS